MEVICTAASFNMESDCKDSSSVVFTVKPARLEDLYTPGGAIKGLTSPRAPSIMARNADTFLLFPSSPLDKSASASDNSLYACWEKAAESERVGRTAQHSRPTHTFHTQQHTGIWTPCDGVQVHFLFQSAAESLPLSKSFVPPVSRIHPRGRRIQLPKASGSFFSTR